MGAGRWVARAAAAVLAAGALAVLGAWLSVPDVVPLARTAPATTALIEQRRAEARAAGRPFAPRRRSVPLEAISPHLLDAVVLSEDARFFAHEGIDWREVRQAARRDLEARRFARGASTITMQLAKNLYLGTAKSPWRKAREALISRELERRLPKDRILELYLDVVELGDGVFGVEEGARRHFGVGADRLRPAQAAALAAMLPAPLRARLDAPDARLRRRAGQILDLLRRAGRLDAGAHAVARAELAALLGGG